MQELEFSVIVPIFECADSLSALVRGLRQSLGAIFGKSEIILVDDGSTDGAWLRITKLHMAYANVKGIRLSTNYGQHRAIAIGLSRARGRWIAVMDGDLQDKPQDLATLFKKVQQGYDVVFARRVARQDSVFRRFVSFLFYTIFGAIAGKMMDPAVGNFSVATSETIQKVRALPIHYASFLLALRRVGGRAAFVDVPHPKRQYGGSSYTLGRLFRYAWDCWRAQTATYTVPDVLVSRRV